MTADDKLCLKWNNKIPVWYHHHHRQHHHGHLGLAPGGPQDRGSSQWLAGPLKYIAGLGDGSGLECVLILEYLVLRITRTLRIFLVSQLNNVQKVKLKQKAKLWNEVQMIKIHIFDDLWAEKVRDNPKSKSTVSRWCWS